MRFRVLGPVSFCVDDTWIRPRGVLRNRLLGMLLAHAGRPIRNDVLADALWGAEPVDRALPRLHLHVHRIRQELDGAERLVAVEDGYRLDVTPDEVDALRFERAAQDLLSTPADHPDRAEAARSALREWPDPLTGTAYDGLDVPDCRDHAERLEALRLDVAEVLFETEVQRGRHLNVLADLQRLAKAHPLRESLQALLMSALQHAGRQHEALRVYRDTRELLVEELGLEPSPGLRATHESVLSGSLAARVSHPSPAPAQLPTAPALTGRDQTLHQLDALLEQRPITIVTGPPGVGKSALAVSWATLRRSEHPDGQLFVDLQGYSASAPVSPAQALDGFIRALGSDPAGLRDLSERTATYRSLVADRRLVVVLDNARSPDQVRPLLPGTPGCRTVITSRDTLAGLTVREDAGRIELAGLTPTDAASILRGDSADASEAAPADDPRWDLLARRCAFLPLALRVAAELVRADPSLLGVLTESDDAREALDLLELGDPDSSAREVFSWSYRALDGDAATVFRALGVNPSGCIDAPGLAALSGLDLPATRRALGAVTRAHLAEFTDGWVRQHDLLAAYAAECAESGADRDPMLARLLSDYLSRVEEMSIGRRAGNPPDGSEAASAWLLRASRPIVELMAAAPASADSTCARLADRLHLTLDRLGATDALDRICALGAAAAERCGDLAIAAHLVSTRGIFVQRMGDVAKGEELVLRAQTLAEASGDPLRQAMAQNNLGAHFLNRGRLNAAYDCFERAHLQCVAVGEHYRARMTLANMGTALTRLRRFDEAQAILDEVYVQSRTADDTYLPQITAKLARLADYRGRHERTRELATVLLDQSRARANPSLVSEALILLGSAELAQGDYDGASPLLEEALAVANQVRDFGQITDALLGLGRLAASTDPSRALELYEQALSLARRGSLAETESRILDHEADLHRSLGTSSEAKACAERAAELRRGCGIA